MIGLMGAVVLASLLGSMHCVGMCGPLALWASDASRRDGRVWQRLSAYHLGRLLTYVTAGIIAGLTGAMLSAGGAIWGAQALAARVVGTAMIAIGIVRLLDWLLPSWTGIGKQQAVGGAGLGTWVTRFVAAQRPRIAKLPTTTRGVAAGALTTLLPCGWLYLFVLLAAGTGAVVPAVSVMVAFWLGTLPALTALVAGTFGMAKGLRPFLPMLGALLLLVTGLYTATGRAAADMRPLRAKAEQLAADPEHSLVEQLGTLQDEPLPCCVTNPGDQ